MNAEPREPLTAEPFASERLLDGEFRHLREAVVMLVDDEPLNIEVTQAYLEEAGYSRIVTTSDSTCVMAMLRQHAPHVLLLDLMMPEVSGFDILTMMQGDDEYKHIPVIVLTSSIDTETKLRTLKLGALDFLPKPVDPTELALRLRNTLAVKAHQLYLTHHDTLTGLPNQRKFIESLQSPLRESESTGREGAVLHIEVDRFAQVIEAFGPKLGDSVLREVAERIQRILLDTDLDAPESKGQAMLARFNAAQFLVLVPSFASIGSIDHFAKQLLAMGATHFKVGERELSLTLTLGIAVFCRDGTDHDTILRNAALALSAAKRSGRNAHRFFSHELNSRALQRLGMEASLRRSLERDELSLFLQPKFDVKAGFVRGAEALLRWQHPEWGIVPPQEFIQLAEDSGLIVPISAWTLRAVCNQWRKWQADGYRPLTISVNVARQQLHEPHFVHEVRDALKLMGQPQHLMLELTEGSVMENPAETIKLMRQLHEFGLQLSLDDFGSGSSSLGFLSRCPVDELKIDALFVHDLGTAGASDAEAVVGAIVAMAHALDMSVAAVGVETQAQLAFLSSAECDVCQGYLLGKPMDVDEFAGTWLERRRKSADTPLGGTA